MHPATTDRRQLPDGAAAEILRPEPTSHRDFPPRRSPRRCRYTHRRLHRRSVDDLCGACFYRRASKSAIAGKDSPRPSNQAKHPLRLPDRSHSPAATFIARRSHGLALSRNSRTTEVKKSSFGFSVKIWLGAIETHSGSVRSAAPFPRPSSPRRHRSERAYRDCPTIAARPGHPAKCGVASFDRPHPAAARNPPASAFSPRRKRACRARDRRDRSRRPGVRESCGKGS